MTLPSEFHGRGGAVNPNRKGRDGRDHHRHGEKRGRPDFIVWDGEGITYYQGTPQKYVLFGASTDDYRISHALTTKECLDLILSVEERHPHAVHVGFAFKYDAEMILVDLPVRSWRYLMRHGFVRWGKYRITYHPGKRFGVSRMYGDKHNRRKVSATIYDTWGFFQSSFVSACRKWLDADDMADLQQVSDGKLKRGIFTIDEIYDTILPYWQAEHRLAVKLIDRLYDSLEAADLVPSEWHGPGALAKVIYQRYKVREHMSRTAIDVKDERDAKLPTLPEEVNVAARHAYIGGHFECYQVGHHDAPVWQYDINSAYPYAISKLPDLADGEWEHVDEPSFDPNVYAIWRITYDAFNPRILSNAFPIPYRDERGFVSYPLQVETWIWTPEAALVADLPQYATITEAWIWRPRTDHLPFDFVPEMYAERRYRKAHGDPSEKALKLALNSLYGKMAQRAGWHDTRPLPRFHQLEWAGYVTSHTRAQLYAAIQQAGTATIAVETDAIFSSKPLDLPTSDRLGDWELTEHDWITYLSSGMYWTNNKTAYRGFDANSITHADAITWLRGTNDHGWRTPMLGTTTRFIGAGMGLGTPQHRVWVSDFRRVWVGWMGKRVHLPKSCKHCREGITGADMMHRTIVGVRGGVSQPHELPWRAQPKIGELFALDDERWNAEDAHRVA